LGVTIQGGGVNVAVVSRHATRVMFCAFEGDVEMARVALPQRLGDVHYGFIAGVADGTHYGLRAEGPWHPDQGHRFDSSKLLLDPYALELSRPFRHLPELAERGRDTAALVPKGVVRSIAGDARGLAPRRPEFIYEIPVKAFTRLHPGVAAPRRGTVAALAEPAIIAHLKRLGADTVELMPLTAWIDERHLPALGLANAWGYNPVSFFAPDPRLAPGGLAEIRRTVDALHATGIRVILDVVFNHSGESDEFGAVLSLRGLDNALYYRHADGRLVNDTGCGNTLALDERPVMQLAMDAMRSWVTRTGIDGFRFDLAPVLGRRASGFDANAPLLAAIEQDPVLGRLTMIAEPWDVGPGGYRLGQFPARWHEWNDRYRDDVRRFWRGDEHAAGAFATRLAGSSDIFAPHRLPSCSVNYVAAHDGFTLRDTVSYAAKDNMANGEGNRDGNGHEPTWPGGDVRALLATLFLSRGTPMLTAGDEFGRTQGGNNNAYAQDNEITWLDWENADAGLIEFTCSLAALRTSLAPFIRDGFLAGAANGADQFPDASWVGADGGPMAWSEAAQAVLGLILSDGTKRVALFFNRGRSRAEARLPQRTGRRWLRIFCSGDGAALPPQSVTVFREERHGARKGLADAELVTLAGAAGIESEWWEVDGTHHTVGIDTMRALLKALGLPHATGDDAAEARRIIAAPTPIIGTAGRPILLAEPADSRRRIVVNGPAGETLLDVAPGSAGTLLLDAGCYACWVEGEPGTRRAIIVSPGHCHLPAEIIRGRRVFGLASHLYSLRHKAGEGAGDLETLRRLAELTDKLGGRYAGLNPLHHLFPADRSRVSPYQPSDRNYIDPIYISIARLIETLGLPKTRAAAETARAAFAQLDGLAHLDYAAVWAAKSKLLERAYAEFRGDPRFDAFVKDGGEALLAHGRFEAERAGEPSTGTRISYRAFLQWIADSQLETAARHGNLYRDLALGCAFDGGEIAADPDSFAAGVSIGAPPDPFSASGQVWNLPPFSPLALAQRDYRPMRRILAANMRHAAALRIDHVLGLARQFWVPKGTDGRDGAYIRFPLGALLAVTAQESQRHHCLVVGEDLGTVPEGLRETLAAAGIFSYRVLWFERAGSGFTPPERYPRQALACLASHDLPTFMGWRAGRDVGIALQLGLLDAAQAEDRLAERAREVRDLADMAHVKADDAITMSAAVHGAVAQAPSQIMLVQADDLSGETDPLNVPGTDREWPNWRRRVSVAVEDLASTVLGAAIVARVRQERPS
jgi:glycogen operon protein